MIDLELYGRESVTINSGGEKIFAEEVEAAIVAHPAVVDCVVAGRPSERWGNEVVAIIALRPGVDGVRRGPPRGGRPSHRPLQVAQGLRSAATDPALALGQGRLPLGHGASR